MKIGIIGAGRIGRALAKKLVKAEYQVVLSNSRGPESLKSLVEELGSFAEAGTVEDAANSDLVILAVSWLIIPEVLAPLKGLLADKIVVDVSNYRPADGKFIRPAKATGITVSELIPQSKVVKAFNHLYEKWIVADPALNDGKRVSFVSGDDIKAVQEVKKINTALGYEVVELGSLAEGGRLSDVGAPLSGLNLISYPI